MIRHFIATTLLLCPTLAFATSVQFQTNMGDIEVELFDSATPETVANFLAYIEDESYNNTFFHRSVPGFIVQGGGFYLNDEPKIAPIASKANVSNEPVYANVRGTIAMAKIGGNPDSATNQWFFNLADNTGNLDNQNGGFTVFGQVTQGMAIVDAIAAVPQSNQGGAFTDIPLKDWTAGGNITEHLIIIKSIVVLNADPDSAANLNPQTTTRTSSSGGSSSGGSSSGGSGSALYLAVLLMAFAARGVFKNMNTRKRRFNI